MTFTRREVLKQASVTGAALATGAEVNGAPPLEPWTLPSRQAFNVVEHTWIPMPDRIRLSVRLWIPESATDHRVPVVLEYIPYRKRDSYRQVDSFWGSELAAHGIAFARVDVRGSGDSEGVLTEEYTDTELSDGEAIIAWLAQQAWCSGSVGMRGISWGGINTLQIAAKQPAALKAIMVMGASDSRYIDDAHYIGGALARANFQWGLAFKTVMAAPPDPAIVGDQWESMWRSRLEATPSVLTKWTQHQTYDAYWRSGSLADNYTSIETPCYLVAGWQDTYANPVYRMLENLPGPKKALFGPWGHTYPSFASPTGLDWTYEEVRWWHHWLYRDDTGIMSEPTVRAFMPYETGRQAGNQPVHGRWIAEDLPLKRTAETLYLHSQGLTPHIASSETDAEILTTKANTVVGTTKREWLDALPIEQSYDDERSLTFDGETLVADVEIMGNPSAHLRIAANQTVAHVAVRLCEVTADGKSWLVSYGLRNLTHRRSDDEPEAIVPGEFFDLDLQLHSIAHRFSKGSRIRVAVSESLWPLVWPSPGSAQISLRTRLSNISLPLRQIEATQTALPMATINTPASQPFTYQPGRPDTDGQIRITHESNPSAVREAEVNTLQLRHAETEVSINEGDPESCIWRESTRREWQRGAWHCAIEADYQLSASQQNFILQENLRAYKDDELVFEHTNEQEIPRHFL